MRGNLHPLFLLKRLNIPVISRVDRKHLEYCVKQCPIGIAIVDKDGRWMWVNQMICNKLGYAESEMVNGMTWMDITPDPQERLTDYNEVQKVLSGDLSSYSMVKSYRTKYGRELRCVLTVVPNHDEDDKFVFFWSFLDELRDIDDYYLKPSPNDPAKYAPDSIKILSDLLKENWIKIIAGLIVAGWIVLSGVFMLGKMYEKVTGKPSTPVIQITPDLLEQYKTIKKNDK